MDKSLIISRARELSLKIGRSVFIVENPISQGLTVFLPTNTKLPDPKSNNYLEVSGRNITEFIANKWESIYLMIPNSGNSVTTETVVQKLEDYLMENQAFSIDTKFWRYSPY